MFNTPRGGSVYGASSMSQSQFADPLATPGYDVDPWSGTQSPTRVSTPSLPVAPVASTSAGVASSHPALDAFLDDPPTAYLALWRQLDPSLSGEISLSTLQRLLATAQLNGHVVEKIVALGAPGSALDRTDFFRVLALVALAQSEPETEVSLSELEKALPDLPLPRLESPRATLPKPHSSWSGTPTDGRNGNSNGNGSSWNPEADAEQGFYNRLETVDVSLIPEREGWFLQKYRVESNKRGDVLTRRYSDFVWLYTTLLKRYPFRLLPALPPKRINPDAIFLEQRRKGLQRFLNAVVNHPVIRDDGALNVFMSEPNFEAWRKRMKVSTEEESASKRLNPAQEMAIPSDLEEKLDALKTRLPSLISSYQKMVTLAERELIRESQAASDATRMSLSVQTVSEEVPVTCHRCVPGGKCCDLCQGISRGLASVSTSWSRLAAQRENHLSPLAKSVEDLKRQRDLYLSFRDLFYRHDRLSGDNVDALRKRVEGRQAKISQLRSAQKPGYEQEVDKLITAIDEDNGAIAAALARRVFIRACMWHELSVVLHSRQAAFATLGWKAVTSAAKGAASDEEGVWGRLGEDLERMPLE